MQTAISIMREAAVKMSGDIVKPNKPRIAIAKRPIAKGVDHVRDTMRINIILLKRYKAGAPRNTSAAPPFTCPVGCASSISSATADRTMLAVSRRCVYV